MSDQVIAIDGPAGSGKSSVARALAAALGWSFLDTGAMYRAVTVAALDRGVSPGDVGAVAALARTAAIETLPRVVIDGRDVEDAIRTERVNEAVSIVAANPEVRSQMVERQRAFAARQPEGTVVEGRDITTVVFPNATVKVFLTASLEERARRRGEEGAASVARRDEADTSRDASPLRQAPDALVLDTTGRTVEEVVEEIRAWLRTRPH
ncbi:MAG TPA: (d)CMP kinase [Acidimicrobiales bacterium]|nr:MAG: cytidylate kinase [Actinobacteria bacterium 21-73-9]HQU25687.1 (d)CMP kinase [Acidimicrobiales bacterium]